MSLTADAVSAILSDARIVNPVLQVLDVKQVASAGSVGTRIRLIVSDGKFWAQAMLGSSMNHLVEAGQLTQHTTIRVLEYQTSVIAQRKIIIVLRMEPMGNPNMRIGTPAPAPASVSMTAEGGSAAAPPAPAAPASAPAPRAPAPTSSAYASAAARSTGPVQRPAEGGSMAGGGTAAFTPISALTPYNTKFTIKARVTAKGEVKTWSNARGTGKLFSVDLVDSAGSEIRGTFFQQAVDLFFDSIVVKGVYAISNGKLKPSNPKFSSLRNQYEVNFDEKTLVRALDEDHSIFQAVFTPVGIAALDEVEKDRSVDVIAVITSLGATTTINSKAGKELTKRDVTLADHTAGSIMLTLWGDKTETPGLDAGVVIAVKGARVGDYNGRTLSTSMSSLIEVNPDHPYAHEVRGWWQHAGAAGVTKILSSRGGGGGGGSGGDGPITTIELRKTLSDLKNNFGSGMPGSEEPIMHVKATITHLRYDDPSKLWYAACPGQVDGRTCNKKLNHDTTTDVWSCERGCAVTQPNYRYIVSAQLTDATGTEYATLFDVEAAMVLGKPASEMARIAQDGAGQEQPAEFIEVFLRAMNKEFLFTLKSKSESYKDEQRMKTTVVKARELDVARECKALLVNIRKYVDAGVRCA